MEPKASTIIDISKRRANHFDPKSDVLLSDTKFQATDLYKSHGEIRKIPMMLGIECSHAKTNRQLINSWQGPIACKGMQGGDGLLATTARGKCGKPVLILNFHCTAAPSLHTFFWQQGAWTWGTGHHVSLHQAILVSHVPLRALLAIWLVFEASGYNSSTK